MPHHTVLVPLDGSRFAERILPLVAAVARGLDVHLELVRVEAPAVLGYSQDMSHATLDVHAEERLGGAQAYLTTTARALDGDGRRVGSTLLTSASVASAICDRARATHAQFVAMTTHGRTGLTRAVLGSVADGVVRQSEVPVLLWHSSAPLAAAMSSAPFRTVLVPLDGSQAAEAILPPACTLAALGDGHLVLVRVVRLVDGEASPTAYLEETAARLRRDHPSLVVDTRVLQDSQPGAAITRCAMNVAADLVAMTSRGHGASRLIKGSTADAVLRERDGAILLLRPSRVSTSA